MVPDAIRWWRQIGLNSDCLTKDLQQLFGSLENSVGKTPLLKFKHEYSVLFECLHAVFGLMMSNQGHLGIYYYVETRSYGMFGALATTFPVLGCRGAGKLTSWTPTTTQIAPPQRPQDSRTVTTISLVVGV